MLKTNYDSDFCGSLPIHLINQVQPYGALLVVDLDDLTILQASENVAAVLAQPVSQVIRMPLDTFVEFDKSTTTLGETIKTLPSDNNTTVWNFSGTPYLCTIHKKEVYYLIEIDLTSLPKSKQDSFITIYHELKSAMGKIEGADSINGLCTIAAKELKRISGFDKVMIYQFDDKWNGIVIAEALSEEMESYYGFTFPASDIPQQARNLYLKNPYRYIPNREAAAVKLYPVINPKTNTFIDISDCNLRSVAGVHIEYLRNMNVMASMSIRILKDEKLWGLIACHHRAERAMDYQMCAILEMLSGIISAKINSIHGRTNDAYESQLADQYAQLIDEAHRSDNLEHCLLNGIPGILNLFNAQGAVVSQQGGFVSAGNVPSKECLDELMLWLHTKKLKRIYHSDALSDQYDQAADYKDIASGILVIPINHQEDSYVIIFRQEVLQVINWGGNPAERIQFEKDERNYHPRNSFKQWQQQVSGASLPWKDQELKTADLLRSFIYEYKHGQAKHSI